MAITHDEIVTTVLRRLTPFAAVTVRDMDDELRSVLGELSDRGEFLPETTTFATEAGVATYALPTLFRNAGHLSISGGNDLVEQAWPDYQRYIEGQSSPSQGEPRYWTIWDGFWWLWPVANDAYTVHVDYWARHAESPAAITFGDPFRDAIVAGVLAALWAGQLAAHQAAEVELAKNRALFEASVDRRIKGIYRPTHFTRYRDI